MARRHDTGWRDKRLALVHAGFGVDLPLAGMTLPMVEYDRGGAVGIISYIRRHLTLPHGPDTAQAHQALGSLHGPLGNPLPFLTAQYDPRNWAFRLFGHNDAARTLLGTDGWIPCTEQHFAKLLYRMRGRHLPDLTPYGVVFSEASWTAEGTLGPVDWPGQDLSVRRREYEPENGPGLPRVAFSNRIPCADIDLCVVGARSGAAELFADFKRDGALVDEKHPTHRAMASVFRSGAGDSDVPSVIALYNPSGDRWTFQVLPLNGAAVRLLSLVRGHEVGAGWLPLNEEQWVDVLDTARGR